MHAGRLWIFQLFVRRQSGNGRILHRKKGMSRKSWRHGLYESYALPCRPQKPPTIDLLVCQRSADDCSCKGNGFVRKLITNYHPICLHFPVLLPDSSCSVIDFTGSSSSSLSSSPAFPPSGFISSVIVEKTGCGLTNSPLTLRAGEGQRINLTLHDVTYGMMLIRASKDRPVVDSTPGRGSSEDQKTLGLHFMISGTCRVYATVRDSDSQVVFSKHSPEELWISKTYARVIFIFKLFARVVYNRFYANTLLACLQNNVYFILYLKIFNGFEIIIIIIINININKNKSDCNNIINIIILIIIIVFIITSTNCYH